MGFYPIFLNLSGRRCIVIGGGRVAQRKVESLLAAAADVTLISPTITKRLEDLVSQAAVGYVDRSYHCGDLAGFDLVFVATENGAVNRAVFSEARARRIWINAADDPDHCDFILPALVRRGDLSVAISTGGKSPAAARVIREELESTLSEDHGRLVQIAAEIRREFKEKSKAVNAEAWNEALKGEVRRLLQAGEPEKAKERLRDLLGAAP